MRNKILKIINDDNGNIVTRRLTESYFKKNYFNLYLKIVNLFDSSLSFDAKLFMIYHEITKKPKCIICGDDVRFKKFSLGFSKYCSMKCIGADKNVQEKREKTTENLYGGKFTLTSPKLINKVKATNLKKYGVEHPQNLDIIKEKTKKTNLKKYGVEHHLKLKSQLDKQKQTNLKKYGVENVNQLAETRDKAKKTNKLKYGTEHPQELDTIKEKTKKTNLKKYGVEYSLQSNIIKEKTKKTNLLKYNTEIPSQNNNIKEKIKAKNIVTKQITSKKYWSDILKLNIEDIDYNNDNELIISNYCIKHNSFIINRSLLKNRIRENIENICTQCNPINENVSIKENEIRDHIKNELNINTEKIRINNKEIDIYLSDYKLGIEFDGLYWHSELFKDKNYHLNKTEECKKQGIQLLHIFEDEWSNKKEIVKSIIRNKLNVTDNKIFARKCQIKEINHDTSSIFLNENHIQGNINTSIRLGLFYNKKLVSIMTFGKKRIALGNKITNESEYEMLRFCNKLNAHVIGGAGKLLSYFIKTYNPKSILTYADRRYSNGNLYEQLGFKFIKNTKPNYWYYNNKTKKCKRYYRYSFRKNILIKNGYDPNKTENQIMNENGYLKIYDCGHMKFEMNFNYV